MDSATYLLRIRFRLEMNVRSPRGLTRSATTGTEDYQDPYDDDMSRLQDIAPDWTYDYRRPERDGEEVDRQREPQERNYYEDDYYQMLREEREYQEYQEPDRYGWDQYAGGYYY
jgi:hypothetical protein